MLTDVPAGNYRLTISPADREEMVFDITITEGMTSLLLYFQESASPTASATSTASATTSPTTATTPTVGVGNLPVAGSGHKGSDAMLIVMLTSSLLLVVAGAIRSKVVRSE